MKQRFKPAGVKTQCQTSFLRIKQSEKPSNRDELLSILPTDDITKCQTSQQKLNEYRVSQINVPLIFPHFSIQKKKYKKDKQLSRTFLGDTGKFSYDTLQLTDKTKFQTS